MQKFGSKYTEEVIHENIIDEVKLTMAYNGFIMSVGTALVIVGSNDNSRLTVIFGMALIIWGVIFIAVEERRINKKIKKLEDKVNELEKEMKVRDVSVVPMKVNPEPPTVVNPVFKIDTTGGMPDMTIYRDWISSSD